jgi:hypothetical protein
MRELATRVGIDLQGSFAYSDSITDVPMLQAVGHPVAVNPDKELRHQAEALGWEIRNFRRPVRLRSRIASAVPAPHPGIAAVVGAAAVAAILLWMLIRSLGQRSVPEQRLPST